MPTSVHLTSESHAKLVQLAREEGKSLPATLDEAIETYRRRRILEGLNADYERLRADPESWAQELAEREAWDATLMDGLEDEPPYPIEEDQR